MEYRRVFREVLDGGTRRIETVKEKEVRHLSERDHDKKGWATCILICWLLISMFGFQLYLGLHCQLFQLQLVTYLKILLCMLICYTLRNLMRWLHISDKWTKDTLF